MKNYENFFVSLRVFNNELWLTEKKEERRKKKEERRRKKKNKMDIFVTGLLDYAKRWKNFEVSFTIDKRSPIV